MSAKHTPGPWHTGHMCDDESSCQCRSILSESYCGSICQITERIDKPIGEGGNDAPPEDEAIANARLIAAAPELLEALEAFINACEKAPPLELMAHIDAACVKARAALSRARN